MYQNRPSFVPNVRQPGIPRACSAFCCWEIPARIWARLAEPECRRSIAALDLAEEQGLPVEWFPIPADAKISMDSGVENMDWIARVLRRLIEFTQAGGEVNLLINGIMSEHSRTGMPKPPC